MEALARVIFGGEGAEGSDHGGGGPDPAAPLDHLVDSGGVAGEERLDGAIPPVADPTVETEFPGGLDRPIAEENTLHSPLDDHPQLEEIQPYHVIYIRYEKESITKRVKERNNTVLADGGIGDGVAAVAMAFMEGTGGERRFEKEEQKER